MITKTHGRAIIQSSDSVLTSLQEAMGHVPPHERKQVAAKFQALFEMYKEGHDWRVPSQFNLESTLSNGTQLYALKVKQVRCYGWYDSGNFVISHYVFKKQKKLLKANIRRAERNNSLWVTKKEQL